MNLHDPHRPTKGKILIVLHQEMSSPGRVGQLLSAAGFQLDIRRPPLGDPLPDTLDGHRGAVVFGGPMSANDPDDFIKRETDWLAVPLKEDKPFLGICLGAQMLVNHLGGRVGPREDGAVEIGWYPIAPTKHGREMVEWPEMVYQFHREGFSLPSGSTLLAGGDVYPNQAFRYGRKAFGIQFHAELTRAMMHSWVVRGASRFDLPGAQPGREHLAGRLLWDIKLRSWLEGFLHHIFEEGADARVIAPAKPDAISYARRDDVLS